MKQFCSSIVLASLIATLAGCGDAKEVKDPKISSDAPKFEVKAPPGSGAAPKAGPGGPAAGSSQ